MDTTVQGAVPGPGLFGKLPSRGDFVTRRLDPACRDALDAWLQAGILTSRRVLGDAWLRAYLNAPVWRFACPAGACGDAPLAGVLMPSMDRVGRYFPLVLAAQLPDHGSEHLLDAAPWFDALETHALDALERETDLNEVDPAVNAVGLPTSAPVSTPVSAPGTSETAETAAPTLFWLPSDAGPPSVLLHSDGLPTPQSFASLLTLHWPSGGWRAVPGQDNGRSPCRPRCGCTRPGAPTPAPAAP